MQPDRLRPHGIPDERFEQRPARGDQLAAELPEEFPPPRIAPVVIGGGEPLLRHRQDTLEMDKEPVFNEMRMDATRPAAEELDLKPGDRMAGRSLDFPLGFERHEAVLAVVIDLEHPHWGGCLVRVSDVSAVTHEPLQAGCD